ncbi:MAG: hypothetical protein NTW74_10450 [Acidobacteria bacterium]|nr:hypothetical protein [Acidobacteriota bacterium]
MRLVILLAACLVCQAQDWAVVKQLPPEKQVIVVLKKERFYGRVQSVSDDSLVVVENKKVITIAKPDIRRVGIRSGSARGKNAAIGAAIGFGIGFTIGALIPGDFERSETRPVFGAIGALAVGAIGAAIPGYSTIYKAK